jgi:hypothetical protein
MRTLLFCVVGALALSVAGSALAGEQSPPQSRTPPASSSSAAAQHPKPVPPAKKVWTNDDIDTLREHGGVSIVGSAPAAVPASGGPAANGANTPGAPANPPTLPKEKDPAWYRKQLAPLYAKLDELNTALANAESAVSGDTRGSAAVSMDATGNAATPQQQLVQLQQQQQQVQDQIDNLEDMARHNGIEPGALR